MTLAPGRAFRAGAGASDGGTTMSVVKLKCVHCGADVALETPFDPQGGDDSGGVAYGHACGVKDLAAGGGVVIDAKPFPGALFPSGAVMVTPRAVAALAEDGRHWWEFTNRHQRGDWGRNGAH